MVSWLKMVVKQFQLFICLNQVPPPHYFANDSVNISPNNRKSSAQDTSYARLIIHVKHCLNFSRAFFNCAASPYKFMDQYYALQGVDHIMDESPGYKLSYINCALD